PLLEISSRPASKHPVVADSICWRFQNCRLSGSWSLGRVTAGEIRRWSDTEAMSAAKTALPPDGEPAGGAAAIDQVDAPVLPVVANAPRPALKSSSSSATAVWSAAQSPGAVSVRKVNTVETVPVPQLLVPVTRQK